MFSKNSLVLLITSYIVWGRKEKKMAGEIEGKSTRGSPVDREEYTLYFIKDCDCGIINEHQLPDSICEPSLTRLFVKCVEQLIAANVCFSSERLAQVLLAKLETIMMLK